MDMIERAQAILKQCGIMFQEELLESNITMRPWREGSDDLWILGIK